jgi:putative endonuclease
MEKIMGANNEFGKQGEELATAYLAKKGYLIISRNYRYLKAEIDIIAQIGNTIAIIEVKSRSSAYFENIAETVSKKKIGLLLSATDNFINTNKLDRDVRFDIITILKKNNKFIIEHFKDAFYHF